MCFGGRGAEDASVQDDDIDMDDYPTSLGCGEAIEGFGGRHGCVADGTDNGSMGTSNVIFWHDAIAHAWRGSCFSRCELRLSA